MQHLIGIHHMLNDCSRRSFLAASVALPAAAAIHGKPIGMDHRTIGKTGLKVAPLGLGERGASEAGVLQHAADRGINYFDTGRAYQNNERLIGMALKGRRKEIVIATKSGGKTKKEALADLETSLRELQTDYVDIWQLHNKTRPEDVTDELLEALQVAKSVGKARSVGVTSHLNVPVMLSHILKRGGVDVMLCGYNFTFQPEVTEAIQSARRAGMGVIAMKVLAGGFARIENSEPRFEGSASGLIKTLKGGRRRQGAL